MTVFYFVILQPVLSVVWVADMEKKTPVRVMTAFFANRQHWYLLSYVFTSLPHFLSDFGRR